MWLIVHVVVVSSFLFGCGSIDSASRVIKRVSNFFSTHTEEELQKLDVAAIREKIDETGNDSIVTGLGGCITVVAGIWKNAPSARIVLFGGGFSSLSQRDQRIMAMQALGMGIVCVASWVHVTRKDAEMFRLVKIRKQKESQNA